MIAIAFVLIGIGVGVWRGVVTHRKKEHYNTSGTTVAILYSVIGLAFAVGCYLAVVFLPLNQRSVQSFKMDSLHGLVENGTQYYVAENFGPSGQQIHNWIIDNDGQTILRSDLVIPSKIYTDSNQARADYVISSSYYPFLWPLHVKGGGYQGETVELHIPKNTVFDNFHLPTDY